MSHNPQQPTDDSHNSSERLNEAVTRSAWVYWTIIGASLLLCLIVFVTLYDIICRFKDKMKSQHLMDGGPPSTPTHSFHYTIGIKADMASPGFDTKMSVIRVELLDNLNRYMTSIAVPCFLLKFRQDSTASKSNQTQTTQSKETQSDSKQSKKQTQVEPQQPLQQQPQNQQAASLHIKSLSLLQEQWVGTQRGELVTFQLTRRQPLQNITSVRIAHDCYVKDSYMILKYIVIYDQILKTNFMVDLKERQIRAIHPCPPSAYQVYPIQRVDAHEDLKSFIDLTRNKYQLCCCPCMRA